jgi:RimJ/RimL family protein N-acetyltransferase
MRLVISLLPIDQSNWRDALDVLVTDDQLPFVADHQPVVLVILAKAYLALGDKRWTPLAIVDDDRGLVGVVALADRAGTCEMFHLTVDRRHQHRGVGTHALAAIVAFARDTLDCGHVELTVHPENESAQRLYAVGGFSPTGEQRHGEPVWGRALRATTAPT